MDGCIGLSLPLWLEDVTPLKARAKIQGRRGQLSSTLPKWKATRILLGL